MHLSSLPRQVRPCRRGPPAPCRAARAASRAPCCRCYRPAASGKRPGCAPRSTRCALSWPSPRPASPLPRSPRTGAVGRGLNAQFLQFLPTYLVSLHVPLGRLLDFVKDHERLHEQSERSYFFLFKTDSCGGGALTMHSLFPRRAVTLTCSVSHTRCRLAAARLPRHYYATPRQTGPRDRAAAG